MVWLGTLGGDVRFAFTSRDAVSGRVAVTSGDAGPSRVAGFSAPPFDELNLSFDVGDDAGAVARNRAGVLAHLDVAGASWLHAQHGREVHVTAEPDAVLEGDGLVTTAAGLGLVALSADCALVVLADPAAGVIGCLHCGRQGLVAGVVDAVVTVMREHGARSIRAAIGPTICGSCYEVPADMAASVVAVVPAAAARSRTGNPSLDIRAGVLEQLTSARVRTVRLVAGCTREDPATFSYRRDHGTGRMGALVWRAA